MGLVESVHEETADQTLGERASLYFSAQLVSEWNIQTWGPPGGRPVRRAVLMKRTDSTKEVSTAQSKSKEGSKQRLASAVLESTK